MYTTYKEVQFYIPATFEADMTKNNEEIAERSLLERQKVRKKTVQQQKALPTLFGELNKR